MSDEKDTPEQSIEDRGSREVRDIVYGPKPPGPNTRTYPATVVGTPAKEENEDGPR